MHARTQAIFDNKSCTIFFKTAETSFMVSQGFCGTYVMKIPLRSTIVPEQCSMKVYVPCAVCHVPPCAVRRAPPAA